MKSKATNEQLLSSYHKTKSVWETARKYGMCGQSIHERLTRLGVTFSRPKFSDEEYERLEREYLIYRDLGKLNELAKMMGRTKPFIARMAGRLGLTSYSHEKRYNAVWKYMTKETAEIIWTAFKQSNLSLIAFCKKRSIATQRLFRETMTKFFPDEYTEIVESKINLKTTYGRGRAFEYRVRDLLRLAGAFAIRSPQSKGPVDVLAVLNGASLMVQCKFGSRYLGIDDWNELYDLAMRVKAIPILASRADPGVRLERMVARKDHSRKAQPLEPISLLEISTSGGISTKGGN